MTTYFDRWFGGSSLTIKSLVVLGLFASTASAETKPYTGQQMRDIASLSDADVSALLNGEGWGLAKPAELNGYPGPAHILELADQLSLTADQKASVQIVFDRMQNEARTLGGQYVKAEAHLSRMFQQGHAEPRMLADLLENSAETLARLRAVHLEAHLEVTPLLTEEQRTNYAELRGYSAKSGSATHGQGHSNH